MSQIKLLHSGGNGVIIAAPDSNPASDRTLKLPSNADGTVLTTTNPKTGNIIQVVSTTKTDTTSTNTSGSFTDISGMSVSITPSSTSSKILILISLGSISSSASGIAVGFKLLRDSTAVGNASSTSNRSGFTNIYTGGGTGDEYILSASHSFLDSPSSTSALTYKIQWKNSSGTTYLGRYHSNNDNNGSSTITVMEIAG